MVIELKVEYIVKETIVTPRKASILWVDFTLLDISINKGASIISSINFQSYGYQVFFDNSEIK